METLLVTGATGALGLPLVASLLAARRHPRIVALVHGDPETLRTALRQHWPALDQAALFPVTGSLSDRDGLAGLAAAGPIHGVLHLAACTKFRAPEAELAGTNVEGTRRLLTWAQASAKPPRFIHFSTTCVAGKRTGPIAEAPLTSEAGFVNAYERTKWETEQLVQASPLQPEIIRLATVIGGERDGRLHRPGAFHTTLRWLHAGLLPMIPGDANTRLDLLHTELVTGFISRLLARPAAPGAVYHLSRGREALPLAELLEVATAKYSARSAAWRSGQILPPVLASRAAFDDFRTSIFQSRDFLFNQVLESVDSFLPELFYPKQYGTSRAESVWGGPLPHPEWRPWIGLVLDYALDSDFGRKEISASS